MHSHHPTQRGGMGAYGRFKATPWGIGGRWLGGASVWFFEIVCFFITFVKDITRNEEKQKIITVRKKGGQTDAGVLLAGRPGGPPKLKKNCKMKVFKENSNIFLLFLLLISLFSFFENLILWPLLLLSTLFRKRKFRNCWYPLWLRTQKAWNLQKNKDDGKAILLWKRF